MTVGSHPQNLLVLPSAPLVIYCWPDRMMEWSYKASLLALNGRKHPMDKLLHAKPLPWAQ